MKYIIKTGRIFYALAMIVYGIQQFIYGDFRNVLFPLWQTILPLLPIWAYLFGLYLIISGIAIIIEKRAYEISLTLGAVLLIIVCFFQIPYQFISEPNKIYHLGLWENVLKESALAGGGFIVAGSFLKPLGGPLNRNLWFRSLEKIQPYASLFFSFTIITFGISHFLYPQFVADLVPSWFHDHSFWSYFGAIALIGSGCCIVLNIRMRAIALIQSIMLFLWFLLLHLPAAFVNPYIMRGNSVSSAFDALAFSGIALLISFTLKRQKWIEDLERFQ